MTNETTSFMLSTANNNVPCLIITKTGNIEFPNSESVDFDVVKIYDENISKITGVHLVFKIKFIEPVLIGE